MKDEAVKHGRASYRPVSQVLQRSKGRPWPVYAAHFGALHSLLPGFHRVYHHVGLRSMAKVVFGPQFS